MLKWTCLILVVLLALVSLAEYVWDVPPMGVLSAARQRLARSDDGGPQTVIRMGVAAWQMDEFPWEAIVRQYEAAHGGKVRVKISVLPEGSLNSQLLMWALQGKTRYDVIVAWSDEEIHPFINYNWNTTDPARRGLLVNVSDHLTDDQIANFPPALFVGSSRKDPQTGHVNRYELPWMGEVLALNYNKRFFQQAGIERPPTTWEEVEQVSRRLMNIEHNGVKVAPLAMNYAQGGFFAQNCYVPMLAAYKKGRGIADAAGRLDVSSPEAVEVFRTLARWKKEGIISPSCMINDSVEQDLRVLRAAMYPHWQSRGLWAVKDHGPEMIGIAPTPGAAEAGSLVCTYGAVVPKCSPIVKQAIEFSYETFCTDTYGFQTAVAKGTPDPEKPGQFKGGGKMPAARAMYARSDLPPGIAELGKSLQKGYFYPDPVNWPQVAEILVVEFHKLLSGTTPTPEEAMGNVRRRVRDEVYREK